MKSENGNKSHQQLNSYSHNAIKIVKALRIAIIIGSTRPGRNGEAVAKWVHHSRLCYLGSDSSDRIALANKIAGMQPTKFSTWARLNVPLQSH